MSATPSFSIVVETANLATADPSELDTALDSLARQELPVERAREVVVFQGDAVPQQLAETVARKHPWVQLERVGAASYAAMKAAASRLTTGEVVVWADSDCRYEPSWLRSLLTPFEDPAVEIVRGETSLEIGDRWSVAQALLFSFPRFSNETALAPAELYHANNVAFRRDVLERIPVPDDPALFRAHFYVHSAALRRAGCTIWRQPLARAHHLPTEVRELPGRFVRLGRDSVLAGPAVGAPLPEHRMDRLRHLRAGVVRRGLPRIREVIREDAGLAKQLPLALPAAAVLSACYYAGRGACLFAPPPR